MKIKLRFLMITILLFCGPVFSYSQTIIKNGNEYSIDIKGVENTIGRFDKFAHDLNISFRCGSDEEKFFIRARRKNILVSEETEVVDSNSISIKVGDQNDIWRIDNDGLKWDIEFFQNPNINIWEWDLLHSDGILFYYQPELTDKEIAKGCVRPGNVIGSYAVYSNKVGKWNNVNYSTGKLVHIYRPKFIDTKGNEIWGELLIEAIDGTHSKMTISVDQDWLDNAVYPVILDPDFGYTDVGGSSAVSSPNYIFALAKGAPSSDGSATSISIYSRQPSNTVNVTFGIYSESGGVPSDLLRDTGEVNLALDATPDWRQGELDSSVSVSNGVTYFIVVNKENSNYYVYYDTIGGNTLYYKSDTYVSGSLPDPFPSSPVPLNNSHYSAYVTYSEDEAPAAWEGYIFINDNVISDPSLIFVGSTAIEPAIIWVGDTYK